MEKNIKANDTLSQLFNKSSEEIKQEEVKKSKEKKGKPYSIMFDLDEYLVDYFKTAKFLSKNSYKGYMNSLVRNDLAQRVGADKNISDEELLKKWEEYKKKLSSFFD